MHVAGTLSSQQTKQQTDGPDVQVLFKGQSDYQTVRQMFSISNNFLQLTLVGKDLQVSCEAIVSFGSMTLLFDTVL